MKLAHPENWPPVRWTIQRLDSIYFWGSRYSEVSAYRFLRIWIRNLSQHEFIIKASAMSYSFFLAFIPAIIFAFSIIPFFPIDNLQQRVETILEIILPYQSYELIHRTVVKTLVSKNLTVLSLSFFTVAFFAIRGVRTMILAFRKADPVHFKRRNFFREYLIALFILVTLVAFLVTGMAIIVLSEWALGHLANALPNQHDIIIGSLRIFSRLLSIFSIIVGISFIYYVAPSLRERWRFFSFGAVVAGVLMFLAHLALRYYAQGLFQHDNLYGGLSAVIILLLWFFYISCVLLIGFEINTSMDQALTLVRRQAASVALAKGLKSVSGEKNIAETLAEDGKSD